MLITPSLVEPSLTPPGAGLPQPELTIARLLLRGGLLWTNPARTAAMFSRERDQVLAMARSCPRELAGRRVLIKRPPGLEDSSRFWSIYMTLEHLRIVNQGIGGVIGQLTRGETPARVTGTAEVKPGTTVGAETLAEFEQGCAEFERAAAAVKNWRTVHKHPHPWFGPLDAGGWYYMAAFHQGLHREQIKRIVTGLAPN